jgi:hypothetical protein
MNKRIIIGFLTFLCLSLLKTHAEGLDDNKQRVLAIDDPIVNDTQDILVEAGIPFLSYAAPYSAGELLGEINRIDIEGLSPEGMKKYERVRLALAPRPKYRTDPFGVSLAPEANLDVNWRSNEGIPWVLGYQERPSLIALPIELWGGSRFYGYFEPALRRDYYSVNLPVAELKGGVNWTSIPIDLECADMNFPFRSFGTVGGDYWSFRIGRDKLSFGGVGEDNLIVSSKAEWYDYARLSLFFRDFQYSGYVVQLDTDRYLYLHRVDLLLFSKLSLGLTEGCLVGQDSLQLRYLNPLMIFHGYQAWNDERIAAGTTTSGGVATTKETSGVGSELGLEADYALSRYVSIEGQFQFNAGQDPLGLKKLFWPAAMNALPTDAAYLLGAKVRVPILGGYLRGDLCGVYSTPYDMILENDDISYIYRRNSNSNYGHQTIEEWIGFSEGPDCILAKGSLGYETLRGVDVALSASYRWKGENDLDTVYSTTAANAEKTTPTGVVEGRLRLGADMSLPIFHGLALSAAAYYTHRANADHIQDSTDQSVELMIGVKASL